MSRSKIGKVVAGLTRGPLLGPPLAEKSEIKSGEMNREGGKCLAALPLSQDISNDKKEIIRPLMLDGTSPTGSLHTVGMS